MLLILVLAGKFRPVLIFMQLHALTLATRSYALLCMLLVGAGQGVCRVGETAYSVLLVGAGQRV